LGVVVLVFMVVVAWTVDLNTMQWLPSYGTNSQGRTMTRNTSVQTTAATTTTTDYSRSVSVLRQSSSTSSTRSRSSAWWERLTTSIIRPWRFSQSALLSTSSSVPLKQIPDFTYHGGFTNVMLFFHIAKTGGTTIRNNFQSNHLFPHVAFKTIYNYTEWDYITPIATGLLNGTYTHINGPNNTKQNTLFIEIHGLHAPGLPTLEPFLQYWRNLTTQHTSSQFFAFTIVREPLSFAVSNFNFFFAEPCSFEKCWSKLYEPTESNMLLTIRPNYQCLLMTYDHPNIFVRQNETEVKHFSTCEGAYNRWRQLLDWMGTTEAMSVETLPLLTQILLSNVSMALSLSNQNEYNVKPTVKPLRVSDLSEPAMEYIRKTSIYDQEIYHRIQIDYPLQMWADPQDQTQS
jgi:hypothetical protein